MLTNYDNDKTVRNYPEKLRNYDLFKKSCLKKYVEAFQQYDKILWSYDIEIKCL